MTKLGEIPAWRKQLERGLAECLRQEGFLCRQGVIFRQGPAQTTQKLGCPSSAERWGGGCLCVTLHFGVRYEAIEDFIDKWPDNPLEPSFLRASVKLVYKGPDGLMRRLIIAKPDDIRAARNEILQATRTTGFAFFQRFSSLEALIEALRDPEEKGFIPISESPTALPVAAALTGQKDKVEQYCRDQYGRIKNLPRYALAKLYPSFVAYLSREFGIPISLEGVESPRPVRET